WILYQVASVAEAVDDIAFGTAKGPMRFGELYFSVVSYASTMVLVEGPPEPMTMPVRSLLISASSRPASAIACCMATWFQAPPLCRKRSARRSISGVGSSLGWPHTWQRKPCSAKESENVTPERASSSEAVTSSALSPI